MGGNSATQATLLAPGEAPDSVIAGLSELRVWSLWIPTPLPVPPDSVGWMATSDVALALWHVSDGGSRSPAVRERSRAFGLGSRLVETLASSTTVRVGEEIVYSDIALANRDARSIAEFLSRPMAAVDSAAALFPSTASTKKISRWLSANLLLSLWFEHGRAPIGLDDLDSVLVAFLVHSVGHLATPVLQLRDASGGMCLLAVGELSGLEAYSKHQPTTRTVTPELAEQIERGLRSPLAP